ncbi:MAG: histidine kinase [Lachnospiraceae bacterium]|nr:histidine kinase [Lachnospiraceae bacterium]
MKRRSIGEIWEDLPVAKKILVEMLFVGIALLVSNMLLYLRINDLVDRLNSVYSVNLNLTDLSDSLNEVQENMYRYLEIRDYDSLSNYYRSEEEFRQQYRTLSDEIVDEPVKIMERNIRGMSESFLAAADRAVSAKRGNNVDAYVANYETAMKLYNYIGDSVSTLNREQFISNRQNYLTLQRALRTMEITSVLILIAVMAVTIALLPALTRNIISPIVERELMMQNHLKEAQLRFLQSQINPHFLFNCLNAGVQLAEMEDDERTSVFLERMADFFRYNVKKGNEESTIREEVEMVNNYIYILNVRFAGEIDFKTDIDDSVLDCHMPSMILQPIVENSVNHGIRGQEADSSIFLTVRDGGDDIEIIVRDTGTGMTEEQINSIFEKSGNISESGSTGIGMDNVISRLRLFFDRDDVLEIYSEGLDKGTSVSIRIPKREEEDVQNTGS